VSVYAGVRPPPILRDAKLRFAPQDEGIVCCGPEGFILRSGPQVRVSKDGRLLSLSALETKTPPPPSLRDTSPAGGGGRRCGGWRAPERKAAKIDRERIVAAARSWLGTPYLHQASATGRGADCLGLLRGVWRDLYGAEPEAAPPYTPDWNERRPGEAPLLSAARRHLIPTSKDEIRPGQALFFRIVREGPVKHCGIVSGEDRFIHAYAGRAVIESWLSRWWRDRLVGVFDFPGAD